MKVFDDFLLEDFVLMIDWILFFVIWDIKGQYLVVLIDNCYGFVVKVFYDDVWWMLDEIVEKKLLMVWGVVSLWLVNVVGDDIWVFVDEGCREMLVMFYMLCQQMSWVIGVCVNVVMSDFVVLFESGIKDWIGGFVVIVGYGEDEFVVWYVCESDDYNKILFQVFVDCLVEVFVEKLYQIVRMDLWGYVDESVLVVEGVIVEYYQGI